MWWNQVIHLCCVPFGKYAKRSLLSLSGLERKKLVSSTPKQIISCLLTVSLAISAVEGVCCKLNNDKASLNTRLRQFQVLMLLNDQCIWSLNSPPVLISIKWVLWHLHKEVRSDFQTEQLQPYLRSICKIEVILRYCSLVQKPNPVQMLAHNRLLNNERMWTEAKLHGIESHMFWKWRCVSGKLSNFNWI